MLKHQKIIFFSIALILLITSVIAYQYLSTPGDNNKRVESPESEYHDPDYFLLKYRDPRTGSIPVQTAQQQLGFLEKIKSDPRARTKNDLFEWYEAGPSNKAGRTRALDIDKRNTDLIITGGVRGGIWKSIDGGNTWYQPDGLVKSESITSIVQHPGLPDTWIATTGEYVGSNGATFLAGVLYRSDDNGETWDPIVYRNTLNEVTNRYEYKAETIGSLTSAPQSPYCETFCDGVPFLYTNNIIVSPTTGIIYVATNGWGILESKDTLKTFTHLLPSIPGGGEPKELLNDDKTSLLLRFDNDALGEEGEASTNSPTLTYTEGIHGQAALLDQGKELIFDVTDNIDSQQGTVEFWIKPEWSGDDGGENNFLLYGEIPGAVFMHRVFGYVEVIANLAGADPNSQVASNFDNTDWKSGDWHHLAFTWSSDKVQAYIDGVLVSETPVPYDLPALTATQFKIGDQDVPVNAYLDEFRISNVVRSSEEILDSYQSGGQVTPKPFPEMRPSFSEIRVHSNGDLLGYVSNSGYFHSTDEGQSWTNIDPNNEHLPTSERSVLAFAPSNKDVAYVLSSSLFNSEYSDWFYKIDLTDYSIEDRSENIKSGDNKIFGNSWNLVLKVKPNDENFVLVGGQQLFRSTDGFETPIVNKEDFFIAGHGLVIPHVDNHIIVFEPDNPNVAWLGNDGGVWRTEDITRVSSALPNVQWQDKNNGYRVTQYYTVAIHPDAGAPQIMGGTQDRGSPTINQYEFEIAPFETDAFGGDGGWCWYGEQYAYASAQGGEMWRVPYNDVGQPTLEEPGGIRLSNFTEEDAIERLFIHPFVLDPNDENILYFPQANKVYRLLDNLSLTEGFLDVTTDWDQNPVMQAASNSMITAISVSHSPANILYYATSWTSPKIYRVENANSNSPTQTEFTIPEIVEGSFINNVAINPVDADEIVVVVSNFNVPGLFHSTDGGQTFTDVEGNLSGDSSLPGPSFEWMDIYLFNGEKYYLLGSRSGLFVTDKLDGANTIWQLQAEDLIGYQLVDMVVSRPSDGKVAVATHGRGIFTGFPANAIALLSNLTIDSESIVAKNSSGDTTFMEGDDLVLDLSITNTGDLESGVFKVVLKTEGDTVAQMDISASLPPGQTTAILDWETGYVMGTADEFTLIVDAENEVNESDETDNSKTFTVNFAEIALGLPDLDELDIGIFPNPAFSNDVVFIKGPPGIEYIRMYDLLGHGRKVPFQSEFGLTSFTVPNLQTGLYIIEVKAGAKHGKKRLFVN